MTAHPKLYFSSFEYRLDCSCTASEVAKQIMRHTQISGRPLYIQSPLVLYGLEKIKGNMRRLVTTKQQDVYKIGFS